jgi:hypothetical protein
MSCVVGPGKGAEVGRDTISFCTTASGPAPRVQALLEIVRPHVDEIVLAVDRAGDPDILDACAHLADRRLTFELRGSPARAVGWVMHECTGDWILRLDDDEVPSADLLAALPAMVAERRPIEFAFRRRWLFPDAERYIASTPWAHEFLPRLGRNLPGLWSFDGRVHTAGEIVGERRLMDIALYHLVLAVTSPEERRRKAMNYENQRPGLVWDGLPVNAYYVPEALEDLETEAVPERDRGLIGAVIDGAKPAEPATAAAPVEAADFRDLDRYNATRTLDPQAYRASISFLRPPSLLPAATVRHHELVVRNDGGERWPPGDATEPLIRLGFRWRRGADQRVVSDGRSVFTETVEPGETTRVLLRAPTPPAPGDYYLEVDVVHEHVRWFDCGVTLPVTIEPAQDAGPLGARLVADESQRVQRQLRREAEQARAAAGAARARLAAAEAVARTRRFRLAVALGRPLGLARRRRHGSRVG